MNGDAPLPSVARILELNPDLVSRSANLYEGYGRMMLHFVEDEPLSDQVMLGASSLAIAGAHWSLVDASRARTSFSMAAESYRRMKRPYFTVLAICGQHSDLMAMAFHDAMSRNADDFNGTLDPDVLLYDTLAILGAMTMRSTRLDAAEGLESLLRNSRDYAYEPLGRVGIPAHNYFSLAEAVQLVALGEDRGLDDLHVVLKDFLGRVDDVIGGAMRDRFHWLRLRTGVLPIEPEIVASCLIADRIVRLQYQDSGLLEVLHDLEISQRQMAPAYVANTLADQ